MWKVPKMTFFCHLSLEVSATKLDRPVLYALPLSDFNLCRNDRAQSKIKSIPSALLRPISDLDVSLKANGSHFVLFREINLLLFHGFSHQDCSFCFDDDEVNLIMTLSRLMQIRPTNSLFQVFLWEARSSASVKKK